MVINNLKELQALIKMLKKEGVDAIKIDNMEFCITNVAIPVSRQKLSQYPTYKAPGDIQADTKIEMPDELTEDQLLMWSSQDPQ